MFVDEVKRKFKIKNGGVPFTLTLLGRDKAAVSGVKSVLLSNAETLRFKLAAGNLTLNGRALKLVELGGGDAYVSGEIDSVEFD